MPKRAQPRPNLWIHAYETSGSIPSLLRPSRPNRPWMDQAPDRFPYRCLPMLIANQWGWDIVNPTPFSCAWTGGQQSSHLALTYADAVAPALRLAVSHFGCGVLTFRIPYLFRTSPGYWLWIKGPANAARDGIAPLEGIVESDWAPYTFTANWQFTRPGALVHFGADEVIATVVPLPRGLVERFDARIRQLDEDPSLERAFATWQAKRRRFNVELPHPQTAAAAQGWQRDYFVGAGMDPAARSLHRTRLTVPAFRKTTKVST